ncbi:unnamed protein product [Linum trigynum]|uniref:Uncharacterized protein n=1 Tax=Linum trigynum TaxID=586398 RepID=A0AAV2CDV0_9ROSI
MQFGKRVKFTAFSPEYAPRWPSAVTSAAVGTKLGLSVDAQIVDANGSLLDWKSMGEASSGKIAAATDKVSASLFLIRSAY